MEIVSSALGQDVDDRPSSPLNISSSGAENQLFTRNGVERKQGKEGSLYRVRRIDTVDVIAVLAPRPAAQVRIRLPAYSRGKGENSISAPVRWQSVQDLARDADCMDYLLTIQDGQGRARADSF